MEVKLGGFICCGTWIVQTPPNMGVNYHKTLEDELNEVTTWASSQSQTIIIMGDFNLDRLKPSD